jgi:hypothetical protein
MLAERWRRYTVGDGWMASHRLWPIGGLGHWGARGRIDLPPIASHRWDAQLGSAVPGAWQAQTEMKPAVHGLQIWPNLPISPYRGRPERRSDSLLMVLAGCFRCILFSPHKNASMEKRIGEACTYPDQASPLTTHRPRGPAG